MLWVGQRRLRTVARAPRIARLGRVLYKHDITLGNAPENKLFRLAPGVIHLRHAVVLASACRQSTRLELNSKILTLDVQVGSWKGAEGHKIALSA